ncbi:biotin-ligase [Lyophyllum atratum]|nr:biotin-ligase [Lyophyllum atratum]
MNVLVYAGPEVLQTSVAHSLATLRSILLPQYSIQTIALQALNSQPWKTSCALLVVPHCRGRLQPGSSAVIKEYVESGGSLLGFGTGAICSSRDQDGAASISKDVLLGFFDKSAGKYIYLTHGNEEPPTKLSILQTSENELVEGIYGGRTDAFSGFDGEKNITVLARFSGEGVEGSIAGMKCEVGAGRIAVWSPNVETPLKEDSSTVVSTVATTTAVATGERRRLDLVKKTLVALSLRLPSEEEHPVSRPHPQFLVSNPTKTAIVPIIADQIAAPSSGSQLSVFKDENDTFHFHDLASGSDLLKQAREDTSAPNDPAQWQPKHIIVCPDALPGRDLTPLFDLGLYYDTLSTARATQGCRDTPESWGCGEALLYGEVVTSTQTMLDKNPRLLSRLPSPLVSLASYQLAGRGRGSNIWLSPSGCLQFSVLLRVSLSSFPASKLVFVQYLFALAVVEACRDESVLGKRGNHVRLKWPNDIYAVVEGERKKIGGILVNTNFAGGNIDIVIGCGLNVLNAAPIFSLAQLLSQDERKSLMLEKTVANILARFDKMWGTFVQERGSFDSFMDLYLERWLHSFVISLTSVESY